MIGKVIAYYQEKFIYKLPKVSGHKFFSKKYSKADIMLMLGLLKSLLSNNTKTNPIEKNMLDAIAKIVFSENIKIAKITPAPMSKIKELSKSHRADFLVLAVILCLCTKNNLENRVNILLANFTYFEGISSTLKTVLKSILIDDISTIKKPDILGEGYQNIKSRLNGLKNFGYIEYKKQMHMMQKGETIHDLKLKYEFLETLDPKTLGGAFAQFCHSQKLSLTRNPNSFAEFFLWHDLSHVISGNDASYAGELATNSFTAGYCDKYQFRILVWGLLQWILGYSLAVVAYPSKEKLEDKHTIDIYLKSLTSGADSKLNLIDWPIDQMIKDLKQDINVVRKKYNIKAVGDLRNE